MKSKIYFVTGVCGVGKSTIIPYLKKLLPQDRYDVRDFDERGVPDGADTAWRKSEVEKWLALGAENGESGIETIVCGFSKDTDLPLWENATNAKFIFLDATPKTVKERLIARYTKNGMFDDTQKVIGKPVTEFIENNVYYSNIMREEYRGNKIVDTTNHTPEEVAKKVAKFIL